MSYSSPSLRTASAAQNAAEDALLFALAQRTAAEIETHGTLSRQRLHQLVTDQFGADGRHGFCSNRDSFDALEAAQVLFLRDSSSSPLGLSDPQAILKALITLERSLPTQTYRSEDQIDFQQFSTPVALAWLAALAARIEPGDVVLEPSAGTGMLTPLAARAGAVLHLNELAPRRAALLANITGQIITDYDGALIDECLPGWYDRAWC